MYRSFREQYTETVKDQIAKDCYCFYMKSAVYKNQHEIRYIYIIYSLLEVAADCLIIPLSFSNVCMCTLKNDRELFHRL